jgi:hypothetical protein
LKNFHDGLSSFGVEGIHQAGDEELYCCHVHIVIPILQVPNPGIAGIIAPL